MPESLDSYLDLNALALSLTLAGKGPFWLLSEMPGNIGDHLIWLGTEILLEKQAIPFIKVSVKDVQMGTANAGTLVVPGSGAFSELWHEWLPSLVLSASKQFDNVVILGSSFDVDVEIVGKALSQKNVFAIAREPFSYSRVKEKASCALGVDPALYTKERLEDIGRQKKTTGAALIAFREDAGSKLEALGLGVNPKVNDDVSLSSPTLEIFLSRIAQSSVIITDRLHVAVAAMLMQRPLMFLDPYDRKISTYFEYVFGSIFVERLEADVADLVSNDWVIEVG